MHCGQNVSWKLLEIISADLLDTVESVCLNFENRLTFEEVRVITLQELVN